MDNIQRDKDREGDDQPKEIMPVSQGKSGFIPDTQYNGTQAKVFCQHKDCGNSILIDWDGESFIHKWYCGDHKNV